jgi:NHS family xanthosine MFS transporter
MVTSLFKIQNFRNMSIKLRLTILSFLQFFIWGSWLISTGGYLFSIKVNGLQPFHGVEIGGIYSTLGIASLFMPALLGIVADRWVNAEKVLGYSHFLGALCLIAASFINNPAVMFWVMLLNSMAYMPTISLSNSVSYRILVQSGYDVQSVFPPIRVWGTIGFICAMWFEDLSGFGRSNLQFYVAAISAIIMGFYCLSLPKCPPVGMRNNESLASKLGLDAFVILKQEKMFVFFFFSMLLGAALQITNTFGGSFLNDFKTDYPDSFVVNHPLVMLSLSQISETLFILTIPFFLKRFGIKVVMIFSMLAWVLRFGLFGIADPDGGFVFLFMSMIVYGMAFDFFNISGSLFIEKETPSNMRASAQGLFMMITNGFGAIIGGLGSGWVVDEFTVNGIKNWPMIWFSFAGYALILVVLFPLLFKYRHFPENSLDTLSSKRN